MIKNYGYALLLDSRLNQTIPVPCLMETRHGNPGVFFYQKPPDAPPQKNAPNIPLYIGYRREIFYKGVFIACSYIKDR